MDNVKINLVYYDSEKSLEKNVSRSSAINPLNEISKLEMGSVIATIIAKQDAGHENITLLHFEVKPL